MCRVQNQDWRFVLRVLALVVVMAVAACSKNSTGPTTEEPAETGFDGLYNGAFILQPSGKMVMSFAYVAPDGEAYFCVLDTLLGDFRLAASGRFVRANRLIEGTFTVFDTAGAPGGRLEITGGKMIETTFQGQQVRGLNAEFSSTQAPFAGSGSLSLAAEDPFYDRPSSLALIAGSWTLVEEDGTTTLNIGANGTISGGTNWGAQFSGQIEVINPKKNLYRVKTLAIDHAGPPYDGVYHGLTAIIEEAIPLVAVKDDGSAGFYAAFSK